MHIQEHAQTHPTTPYATPPQAQQPGMPAASPQQRSRLSYGQVQQILATGRLPDGQPLTPEMRQNLMLKQQQMQAQLQQRQASVGMPPGSAAMQPGMSGAMGGGMAPYSAAMAGMSPGAGASQAMMSQAPPMQGGMQPMQMGMGMQPGMAMGGGMPPPMQPMGMGMPPMGAPPMQVQCDCWDAYMYDLETTTIIITGDATRYAATHAATRHASTNGDATDAGRCAPWHATWYGDATDDATAWTALMMTSRLNLLISIFPVYN